MNGPEHYQKAEQLLARSNIGYFVWNERNNMVAQAQVHATLAQAAALTHRFLPTTDETKEAWLRVVDQG